MQAYISFNTEALDQEELYLFIKIYQSAVTNSAAISLLLSLTKR